MRPKGNNVLIGSMNKNIANDNSINRRICSSISTIGVSVT